MRVPLSWIKDYVDISDIEVEDLAHRITLAGLEVEEIDYIGLPMPVGQTKEFKSSGLSWEKDKFVVAAILEVNPHPDADRLVLCRLEDDHGIQIVL
ncbi:MAG: hypothetical protein JXA19_02485, partial [Anaerolineales bacterium]|nr:hypothetical protein [Anaerolineales bacterium]